MDKVLKVFIGEDQRTLVVYLDLSFPEESERRTLEKMKGQGQGHV